MSDEPMNLYHNNLRIVIAALNGSRGPLRSPSIRDTIAFPVRIDDEEDAVLDPRQRLLESRLEKSVAVQWRELKKAVTMRRKMGEGVQGAVYQAIVDGLTDGNGDAKPLVMKLSHLEDDAIVDPNLANLLAGTGGRRDVLVLKDPYADAAICFLCSKLRLKGHIWGVCLFFGSGILGCSNCADIFTCKGSACVDQKFQILATEQARGNLKDYSEKASVREFHAFMCQLLFNLAVMQNEFRFAHNDLHDENVMYSEVSQKFYWVTYVNEHGKMVRYKIPTFGKAVRLIDFGRSHMYVPNRGRERVHVMSECYAAILRPDTGAGCELDTPCPGRRQNTMMDCADGTRHYSDMVNVWYCMREFLSKHRAGTSPVDGASPDGPKRRSRQTKDDESARVCLELAVQALNDGCGDLTLEERFRMCKKKDPLWRVGWQAQYVQGGCDPSLSAYAAFPVLASMFRTRRAPRRGTHVYTARPPRDAGERGR